MESRSVPRSGDIRRSRAPRRRSDRWTDREDRYICAHRDDGYLLISEGLGAMGSERTPAAVKAHARRRLRIRLRRFPASGMRKCVVCGRWEARPSTPEGREGYCPSCWRRRLTEALSEGREELAARREYATTRKRRARERGGAGEAARHGGR